MGNPHAILTLTRGVPGNGRREVVSVFGHPIKGEREVIRDEKIKVKKRLYAG